MVPIVLRDYQLQLLADLRAALKVHQRVCAVMPTGAGKSLMVDALGFLSGLRADSGVVRHGAERAELSAEFSAPSGSPAQAWLADVLARIAGHPVQKIDELMPWNWRKSNSAHDALAA